MGPRGGSSVLLEIVVMKTLLRLTLSPAGRVAASWGPCGRQADVVPRGERLVGLAVVAFLLLALFA